MSIENIIRIEPVIVEGIPIAAKVTFRTKRGTRTYLYDGLSVAAAILEGQDPIEYAGTLIEQDEEPAQGRTASLRPPKVWRETK